MPRTVPEPPTWHAPPGHETITLHLKLITPVFGGGYEPREVDPLMPIRPAAIRGHLRFWWRALYGEPSSESADMLQREALLWGTMSRPGSVRVTCEVLSRGLEVQYASVAHKADPRRGPRQGVFLFPFQEQRSENLPAASACKDAEFEFCVSWEKGVLNKQQEAEIRGSVRAWIAFGGVGARTRRGCGALTLKVPTADWLPPAGAGELGAWLRSLVEPNSGASPTGRALISSLRGATVVLGSPGDAMAVWERLGTFWASFRKGHVGETPYEPMRGGKWLDFATLRRLHGRDSARLNKPYLGLPIIYQKLPGVRYAPKIEAEGSGRMASPVILKPLSMSDGSVRPMVAILRCPSPSAVRIDGRPYALQPNGSDPVLKAVAANDPLGAVVRAAVSFFRPNPLVVTGRSAR